MQPGGWALLEGGFLSDMTAAGKCMVRGAAMIGDTLIQWLRQRPRGRMQRNLDVPTAAWPALSCRAV